jgi:hypothetical protein
MLEALLLYNCKPIEVRFVWFVDPIETVWVAFVKEKPPDVPPKAEASLNCIAVSVPPGEPLPPEDCAIQDNMPVFELDKTDVPNPLGGPGGNIYVIVDVAAPEAKLVEKV